MNTKQLIEELLLDVSVHHPIPDFRNPEHVDTLLTICEQKGYSQLIPTLKETFLNEAPAQTAAQKMGLVHLGRGYYGKKAGGPATHRSEDGKIIPLKPQNTDGGRLAIDKAIDQAKEQDKEVAADPYQSMLQGKTGDKPEEKEKEKSPEEKEHDAAINTPEKVLNDPKASSRSVAVARAQQTKNSAASAGEEDDANETGERKQPEGFKPIESSDVVEEMPDAKADTFVGKSDLPNMVGTETLEQFNTDIDKLAKVIADAKQKGGTIPNVNLCQVSIPGTNLYCDDNLGIPREEMPQFKGKPIEGSKASKMPLDQSGEVDTEPVFKEMLKQKGIKTLQTEVPADKLKATQSELVGAKVLGMMGALEKDPNHPAITAPIYVSRDGYVVDGHHRWAAVVAYNAKHPDAQIPMRVTVIDDDIKNVIPMANKFAEDIGIAAKKADANKETPTTKPKEIQPEPKYPQTDVPKAETPAPPAPKISSEEPKSQIDRENDSYGKGKAGENKPKEEPTVTDDEVGTKAKTKSGKTLYHIGGGYYSDSPNGVAKYIRVESIVERAIETGSKNWWNLLFEADIKATVKDGGEGTFREIPKGEQDAATVDAKQKANTSIGDSETGEETLPDKITLNKEQETLKQNINSGDLSVLKKSATNLNKQRDLGVAGAGGPVASYGEARLTSLANEINEQDGYEGYVEGNREKIDVLKDKISKDRKYQKIIDGVSKQLGYTLPADQDKVAEYIAARELYTIKELARLKKNKNSLWYKSGKSGFGENEEAFREWARAQFDGSLTTISLVKEQSNIDPDKPFTVIQSNPKEGGHDAAILSHLEQKLEEAKQSGNQDDITHYEREIKAFRKLGFHDTMVIGQDKNNRTTILHITNKKQNDLQDIWGNTTPEYALNLIKKSFSPEVSNKVVEVIENGIVKVSNSKKATTRFFSNMRIDDDFVAVCSTPQMKKYMTQLKGHKKFKLWLEENKYNPTESKQWLTLAQKYVKENEDAPYEPFGKFVHKVGELSQVGPFVRKHPNIDFNSKSIKASIQNKNDEKELTAAVHRDVVDSINEADKELGFPKKDGINGPHTQAYLTTVMHSMHFDLMVENFDGNLGAVTGIRGTTPSDFRECLAKLSGFKGDIKTKEGRNSLNRHLLERCKLNPKTRAIEITNEEGTTVLAEDTWRTAGTSQKVEKKLGDGLRKCVANRSDLRKSGKNTKSVKEVIQSLPKHLKEKIATRLKETLRK